MIEPICKFNDSKANSINCSQFIYETTEVQANPLNTSCHQIGIILRGNGILTINGDSTELNEGSIYFVKKGSTFSIRRLSSEMEYYYISFSGWHADELAERVGASNKDCVFWGNEEISEFWRQCFDRSESGNLDLFSEAALLFAVAYLSKTKAENRALSDQVAEYANSNFSDPSLNLSRIAHALGYDPKYLSAQFKSQKRIAFTAYLRGIRVRHAAFLFDEGVESIKTVAMLSGFSDALYFSRIFRQDIGITPTEYIRQVRKNRA